MSTVADFKRDWEALKRLLTRDDVKVDRTLADKLDVKGGALFGASTPAIRRQKGRVRCFVTLDDWTRQVSAPIRGRFLLSMDCAETDWGVLLDVVAEILARCEKYRMDPVPVSGDAPDVDGSHVFEMVVTPR